LTGRTKTEKESESEITMCDRMQMYNTLKEEIVLNILKESDECVISDSSDDGDDCDDDSAVAHVAVNEEDSQVEEEGQSNFLGDSDYNVILFGRTW
jgi:hypothetical protein